MTAQFTAKASIAALLVGLSLSVSGGARKRTIFTTTDFRQDRDRWTDPAYYRNNTAGQLRGMAINVEGRRTGQELSARVYGSEGTGKAGCREPQEPVPVHERLGPLSGVAQASQRRNQAHQDDPARLERSLGGRSQFRWRRGSGQLDRRDADAKVP